MQLFLEWSSHARRATGLAHVATLTFLVACADDAPTSLLHTEKEGAHVANDLAGAIIATPSGLRVVDGSSDSPHFDGGRMGWNAGGQSGFGAAFNEAPRFVDQNTAAGHDVGPNIQLICPSRIVMVPRREDLRQEWACSVHDGQAPRYESTHLADVSGSAAEKTLRARATLGVYDRPTGTGRFDDWLASSSAGRGDELVVRQGATAVFAFRFHGSLFMKLLPPFPSWVAFDPLVYLWFETPGSSVSQYGVRMGGPLPGRGSARFYGVAQFLGGNNPGTEFRKKHDGYVEVRAPITQGRVPFFVSINVFARLANAHPLDTILLRGYVESDFANTVALQRVQILDDAGADVTAEAQPTLVSGAVVPTGPTTTATLILQGLTQTYDGSPRTVRVGGLPDDVPGLVVLYDGLGEAPVEPGSYEVTATLGNPFFEAAPVTDTLHVLRAPQVLQVAAPERVVLDVPFRIDVTAGASNAPVSVESLTPDVCAVVPSPRGDADASSISIGACRIAVSQGGTSRYLPAATVNKTVAVEWPFTGFFEPLSGTLRTATAGSTIPVKFSLGGDRGLAIVAAGFPISRSSTACDPSVPDPSVATETESRSGLRYDTTAGRYVYAWKTERSWAGQCREFVLRLIDGSDHTTTVQF